MAKEYTLEELQTAPAEAPEEFSLDDIQQFNKVAVDNINVKEDKPLAWWESIIPAFVQGNRSSAIDTDSFHSLMGATDYYTDVQPKKREFYDQMQDVRLSSAPTTAIAQMLPAMAKGIFQGGMGAVSGAGTGAATAAAVGAFIPFPEELATVPIGMAAGASVGGKVGSMQYWYRQGAGSLYGDLKDENVEDNIAKPVAHIAGAIYAGIEFAQVDKLIPGSKEATKKLLTKSVKQTLKNLTQKYGVDWIENVTQEGVQEFVMQASKNFATNVANKTDTKTGDLVWKASVEGWKAVKESAVPLLLMVSAKGAVDVARVKEDLPKPVKTKKQETAINTEKPIVKSEEKNKAKKIDAISIFNEVADLMSNVAQSAVVDGDRLGGGFPILSKKGITQDKLATIKEKLANRKALTADETRIFNLAIDAYTQAQERAQEDINEADEAVIALRQADPSITDKDIKDILAEIDKEELWDEERIQKAVASYLEKESDSTEGTATNQEEVADPLIEQAQGVPLEEFIGSQPRLITDNPGGFWLDKEKEKVEKSGRRESGAYKNVGATTAELQNGNIKISVDKLSNLTGMNNEQKNPRKDAIEGIKKVIEDTGKLPLNSQGKEYAPHIIVDKDGVAWVAEGNHRIMAAKALGIKEIPIQITYTSGAEQVQGEWNPSNLNIKTKSELTDTWNQAQRDKEQKSIPREAYKERTPVDPTKKAEKVEVPPRDVTIDEDSGEVKLPEMTKFQKFRRWIEDFNIRLKQLNNMIEDRTGTKVSDSANLWALKDMLPRVISQAVENVRKARKNFVTNLANNGIPIEVLDQYLLAKHAQERNAKMNEERTDKQDGLSGMTDAEAQFILDNADPRLEAVAQTLYDMQRQSLRQQVEQGLISEDEYKQLTDTYQFYVPLFRDVESDGIGIGTGVDIRGREYKRAKGSTKDVLSPTGNIFAQQERVVTRSAKNKVGQGIVELVNAHPELKDIFEISGQQYVPKFNAEGELIGLDPKFKFSDDTMGTKIDGKQVFIKIKDPDIARALKNLNVMRVDGFLRTSRAVLGIWASLKTRYNPEFLITNLQRDLGEGLINIGLEKAQLKESGKKLRRSIIKDLFPSQKQIFQHITGKKEDATVQEFLDLGGDTGHFYAETAQDQAKSIMQLEREINNEGIEKVKNVGRRAFEFIDHINSTVELGIRFSTYKELVKRGMSKQQASQVAADLTINFSRQGEASPFFKAIYGFFNPAIQGASKVARTATNKDGRKSIAKAATGLAVLGFVTRMASIMYDDEGDDNIPEYAKNTKVSFAIGNGAYVTLFSMPYGYTTFYAIGGQMAEVMMNKKTLGGAFKDILSTAVNSFSPFNSNLNSWVPTLVRPVAEVAQNEGWHEGRIHPSQMFDKTPAPNNLNYFEKTSQFPIFLAAALNKLSGGSDKYAGLVDISPNDLEYMFSQYVGGGVEFIMSSIETGARSANGEFDPNKTPFVRKFVRNGRTETFTYNTIYDVLDKVNKKPLTQVEKDRFIEAVERGEENAVFSEKKGNEFKQVFYKALYDIEEGRITDKENVKQLKKMPRSERRNLINTYSRRTRNKLRFLLR